MKKTVLALIFVFVSAVVAAQTIRAITEDGRDVLLSPNGTWQFNTTPSSENKAPPASGDRSTYQPAMQSANFTFDSSEWAIRPQDEKDERGKRSFQHKSLPIYGMVISDELQGTNKAMKNVIISNAQGAGKIIATLVDQVKSVNGKSVGTLRTVMESEGLRFVFDYLYFADNTGNIQVICYTGQSLFSKYQADCQKFLNGLSLK